MFGTRKLIIKGLTAGGRLGPPSIPLGYASLHYERAQPMTLANDLKVFNFRWQSGVQFWVAVHNNYSKVVVLVSNESHALMRTLTFEEEAIKVEEDTKKEVTEEGGEISLEFFSNIPYKVTIPDEATSWISISPQTKHTEKQKISLFIKPNPGASRDAIVTVTSQDGVVGITYRIIQAVNNNYILSLEREALMALYNATDGPNWNYQFVPGEYPIENWGTNEDVSKWSGIDCNENGRVIGISLMGESLRGSLPDELSNLTELKSLALAHNGLTGEFPSFILDLKNLEQLQLDFNYFSGELPPEIGNLSKLKDLDLSNNYFTGTLPASLSNLTSVQRKFC